MYRKISRDRDAQQWCVVGGRLDSELLFNVTINDISVIYVTAHRCQVINELISHIV